MTVEQRVLIDPSDVVAIELECKACASRLRFGLSKMQEARLKVQEYKCPNCSAQLIQPDGNGPDVERLINLVQSLRTAATEKSSAIVRLEVKMDLSKVLIRP